MKEFAHYFFTEIFFPLFFLICGGWFLILLIGSIVFIPFSFWKAYKVGKK